MNEMPMTAEPSGSDAARTGQRKPDANLAERRAEAQPFAVFLYIWGMEWFVSSLLLFFDPGQELMIWRQTALFAAILATAAAWLWRRRKGGRPSGGEARLSVGAVLPVLAAALIIVVLRQNGVIDALYVPLLKGLVLAAAYGALSLRLGRPLLYLSLWMLALTLTVTFAYLGYASVLLGAFGGMSLIALGRLFGLWNTVRKRGMRQDEG